MLAAKAAGSTDTAVLTGQAATRVQEDLFRLRVLEATYQFAWTELARTPNVIMRWVFETLAAGSTTYDVDKALYFGKQLGAALNEGVSPPWADPTNAKSLTADLIHQLSAALYATMIKSGATCPTGHANNNFWLVCLSQRLAALLPKGNDPNPIQLPPPAKLGKPIIGPPAFWPSPAGGLDSIVPQLFADLENSDKALARLLEAIAWLTVSTPTGALLPQWFVKGSQYRHLGLALIHSKLDYWSPAGLLNHWRGAGAGIKLEISAQVTGGVRSYKAVVGAILDASFVPPESQVPAELVTTASGLDATMPELEAGKQFVSVAIAAYKTLRRDLAVAVLLGVPLPLTEVAETMDICSGVEWAYYALSPGNSYDLEGQGETWPQSMDKCAWAGAVLKQELGLAKA